MGSVYKIKCDNCSFSVSTSNNLTKIVCEKNLDYYDDLYCLDCKKVVKVWQRKKGKDMENKCPECGSRDVFLLLPDKINVICPSCKKGNLQSDLYVLID